MWNKQIFVDFSIVFIIVLVFIKETKQEYKIVTIEEPKLCSPLSKKKIKLRDEALIVDQGRSINEHSIPWTVNDYCKFQLQSFYHKGGIIAVIQKLNLRTNTTSGDCIDYIQFSNKHGFNSKKYCGSLDANIVMNYLSREHDNLPVNSYINTDGELDVTILISKTPLNSNEHTEFNILFTSYKDCSEHLFDTHPKLRLKPCDNINNKICINELFFDDGYINCPFVGCVDEQGCLVIASEPKESVGKKVIIGSVSTLCILMAIFILFLWIFKKHKLFCWAEDFAHPSATPESNRNSRIMEMNNQTGARLAESQATVEPSAPVVEEDKDLPPSYDSLFPNPRIKTVKQTPFS